jgi:hypothetical protein
MGRKDCESCKVCQNLREFRSGVRLFLGLELRMCVQCKNCCSSSHFTERIGKTIKSLTPIWTVKVSNPGRGQVTLVEVFRFLSVLPFIVRGRSIPVMFSSI